MAYDGLTNFPLSTVATAPSPASSGTSLVVAAGQGALFPAAPFNIVIWPVNTQPTSTNAEIARVTAVSTDTLTITRAQEGTSARTVIVGDQVMLGVTKKILTDLQNYAPQDGWMGAYTQAGAAETWTYASADAPTYTFTISGDLTGKYSPGMRIKLTQSATVKYFIITAVSFGSPNTTVTVLSSMTSGTVDNSGLANSAISANFYSPFKAPLGFPLDPLRWMVSATDTTDRTQSSPTQGTWYNVNAAGQLVVPIGSWILSYRISHNVASASLSTNVAIDVFTTLSTANNTESDADFTTYSLDAGYVLASNLQTGQLATATKPVLLAAKTTYYLNSKTGQASMLNFTWNNGEQKMVIRAISAYL